MANHAIYARCPWCSKQVKLKRGRITEHVTSGNIRCIGVGKHPPTIK